MQVDVFEIRWCTGGSGGGWGTNLGQERVEAQNQLRVALEQVLDLLDDARRVNTAEAPGQTIGRGLADRNGPAPARGPRCACNMP